jgi:hypothetical protein
MGGIMGRGRNYGGRGRRQVDFLPGFVLPVKSDVTGGGSFSVAHYSVMVGDSFPLDNKPGLSLASVIILEIMISPI